MTTRELLKMSSTKTKEAIAYLEESAAFPFNSPEERAKYEAHNVALDEAFRLQHLAFAAYTEYQAYRKAVTAYGRNWQ